MRVRGEARGPWYDNALGQTPALPLAKRDLGAFLDLTCLTCFICRLDAKAVPVSRGCSGPEGCGGVSWAGLEGNSVAGRGNSLCQGLWVKQHGQGGSEGGHHGWAGAFGEHDKMLEWSC